VDNLKEDAAWRGMYVFTIVMAVLTIAIGIGLAFAVRSGLTGLLERLMLASGAIWVEVMSIRIYQLSRRKYVG